MNRPSHLLVFLAAFLSTGLLLAQRDHHWQAGVSSTVITPDQPMWLSGYAARNKAAEGKIHDLRAKALALRDKDGARVVIITTDLLGIPQTLRERVETAAGRCFQLKPEELILSASHTHCGPEIDLLKGLTWGLPGGRAEQITGYLASLEESILNLIEEALANLAPASLSYSYARAGFAMNRRLKTDHGVVNSPNPDGPVDHSVPVLQVQGRDGQPRALLFGYACHNTTLSFYNYCGDYAGFAQSYLEQDHPEALALFISGCAGDQNPYPRRSLALAQQHGRALANAVETALETPQIPLSGPLRTAMDSVELEFATPPSRNDLTKKLSSSDQYEQKHARMMLEQLDEGRPLPVTYAYPVQVIDFGPDLTLVALGGEVVVDYSLRLKAELKGSLWVAAYCNDVMGYVPTARMLREGGYEPIGSTKFYGLPGPFAESVEELIVGKVHELVGQLTGSE